MLENEITKLAVAIREAATNRRLTKSIATLTQVRVKRRDFTLKYHDDFGFANFQPERSNLELWDPHDQEVFQKSFVRDFGDFEGLVAELGTKASLLDQFVRSMCFAAFHGLDDEELRARVNSLCCQFDDKPIPVKVTAFVDGLSIEASPLHVHDSIILRKPVPEDLAQETLVDEYGGFNFSLNETWFHVVGEFVFDVVELGQAQREFLRTIEALRLFRLGGVATNRFRMDSRHFMSGGTVSYTQTHSLFAYTLSNNDADALARFLSHIVPVMPDPFKMDQATTDVGIAHARYVDALFQTGTPDRQITSAITALEAIFLRKEPELTHRLAQRAAMFLKFLGPERNAKAIYSSVVRGYKIRSNFIHGGSLKGKDLPEATTLAPVLLDYARRCVLARLQLQSLISKDDLLAKLDEAMIDSCTARDVQRMLRKVTWR